jgi:hypothetical protein
MLSKEEKKSIELVRKAGETYRAEYATNKKNGTLPTFNERVEELGDDFGILRLGY